MIRLKLVLTAAENSIWHMRNRGTAPLLHLAARALRPSRGTWRHQALLVGVVTIVVSMLSQQQITYAPRTLAAAMANGWRMVKLRAAEFTEPPEPADPPPTDPAAAYVPLAALGAALHAWGVDLYGYSGKALELAQGAVNRLAFL